MWMDKTYNAFLGSSQPFAWRILEALREGQAAGEGATKKGQLILFINFGKVKARSDA
jgi:hypothetical protein